MITGNGGGPISWRDTYQLVQAAETKILSEIRDLSEKVGERLQDHDRRIDSLEAERDRKKGQSQAFLGISRVTLALLTGFSGLVIAILKP
jgi:hypothetical protein